MNSKPVVDLADALHDCCETAVLETSITPAGLIEALATVLGWVVAVTDAEHHERLRSGITALIPNIFEVAREAQERTDESAQ